jgi:hypothetical protein
MSEYPSRYMNPTPDNRLELLRQILELERRALAILLAGRDAGDVSELDVVRQSSVVRRAELELLDAGPKAKPGSMPAVFVPLDNRPREREVGP